MKKLLAVVCALAFCLALGACSSPGSTGPGAGLEDGTYAIEAETDSSMFRVETCLLTVENGEMTAAASLPGQGFSRLFFGSVEDAEKAPDDQIYEYYLNDEGKYTFDVPVAAFEEEIEVAAFGHRRDTWYPHTIIFHAPTADSAVSAQPAAQPAAADSGAPAEGEYQVAVTLEGGTGRATVQSPTKIVVADGKMTATIVWSSPNYDQMIVDGEQYLPVNTEGNSTFEIPVKSLDEDLPVQAETTAMSEPHMIDYTLHFDAESLK